MDYKKYFYLLFCFFIAVNLFWIIVLRIYPFVDLPNHLYAATVTKFYNQPDNSFAQFYSIPSLLKSNTFHFFFVQLPVFPSVEFGNKIFYCLYVILMPLSVLMLIRKLRGNIWFAILSFFFVFNFNVMWGFVGFTMSVPALLFFLLLLIDFFEQPKWIYVFGMMLSLSALFFIHLQTALFAMLIILVCSLYKRKSFLKNIPKKIIIVLPVIILSAITWNTARSENYSSTVSYLLQYYSKDFWLTFHERLIFFFLYDNDFLFESIAGGTTAAVITLIVLAPFVLRSPVFKRKRMNADFFQNGFNAFAIIFLICASGCYIFLPQDLPGQSIVYQRFSSFVLVAAIICGSVINNLPYSKSYIKVILVSAVVYACLVSHYFFDFKNETATFTENIFPDNANEKVLAGMIYHYKFRGQPIFTHFQSYYGVWKKGICTNGNVDYRFRMIERRVSMEKLPPHIAFLGDVNDYNGEYQNLDYILAKDDNLRPQPGFKLAKHENGWQLWSK